MNYNKNISLREKIGSMLMFGFRGTSNCDDDVIEIIRDIKEQHIGGVILFNYNIFSKTQLKILTDALSQADSKLLIALDQEGGKVQRLSSKNGFNDTESARSIAANYTQDEAFQIYDRMAGALKSSGINFNFGPVVDVDTTPPCPVIGKLDRSFSDDPQRVIDYAKQFIDAHNKNNIITTLKHFPGHGFAKSDTHLGLVDMTNTANLDTELQPYKTLLKDLTHTAIMTSHIVNYNLEAQGLPATLSKSIVTGLLREKLEWKGVVVTDALEMGAIRKHYKLRDVIYSTINAGNDILVFTRNSAASLDSKDEDDWNTNPKEVIDIIEQLVLEGKILEDRIDQSYHRISKLKDLINTEDTCLNPNYYDNEDMSPKSKLHVNDEL